MKSQHVQQECMIFTNTTLLQKALCKKNSGNKNGSASSELEEAFWNGFLNELVPEIMLSIQHQKMVIRWVHTGKYYLLVDMSDNSGCTESILSIDPHLLISEISMN